MMMSFAFEAGASSHKVKVGVSSLLSSDAIDQAVDGGCAVTALAAHDQRGLAGEGREQHLAVDVLGNVLGERGLAGAGIAEQAEHLRRIARAGPGLEPVGNGSQRSILMGREDGHAAATLAALPCTRDP